MYMRTSAIQKKNKHTVKKKQKTKCTHDCTTTPSPPPYRERSIQRRRRRRRRRQRVGPVYPILRISRWMGALDYYFTER